jgi:RND family efflux transporter MFP subunit
MRTLSIVRYAALVALAASAAAGCTKAAATALEGTALENGAPQPVKAAEVAMAAAPTGVRYSATIEPAQQVTLSFKASGYVDAVLQRATPGGGVHTAQQGDRVSRGLVLARVRETEYRERVKQGRARVDESEASRVKAQLDLERAKTLFASQSLTKPDLDGAQAAFDAAEARIASARADLALALTALGDTTVVSPINAVILERTIEVGMLAGAGTQAFVLGDVSTVKARFGIPDSMVQAVALGDTIDVNVDAAGTATFAGRITAIAPAADPQSRVFDVEVSIANKGGELRPGMIGAVTLMPRGSAATGVAADAPRPLTVPLTAVVRSTIGGQFAVAVVETSGSATVARLRQVELGEVIGNAVAVTKGVSAGERVVVSGATLLVDGAPIRVLAD